MTDMKKLLSFLLVLLLAVVPYAAAEDTAEYRDEIYAFRYPASWSCGVADNGDIVLGSPDRRSAVLTYAVLSDLWPFTGESLSDGPIIEQYISSYGGKNLALNGEYELTQAGDLKGFRAFGSWRATGQDAVMLMLSGGGLVVGFVLVGDDALALEEELTGSVEPVGKMPSQGAEGFLRWESGSAAVEYPSSYSVLDQATAAMFADPEDPANVIMAKVYSLDVDYTDGLAPAIAANALPRSANVESDPEMTAIGGRNAALIRGTVSGGPMEFYVIGGGRTALALVFLGEKAVIGSSAPRRSDDTSKRRKKQGIGLNRRSLTARTVRTTVISCLLLGGHSSGIRPRRIRYDDGHAVRAARVRNSQTRAALGYVRRRFDIAGQTGHGDLPFPYAGAAGKDDHGSGEIPFVLLVRGYRDRRGRDVGYADQSARYVRDRS